MVEAADGFSSVRRFLSLYDDSFPFPDWLLASDFSSRYGRNADGNPAMGKGRAGIGGAGGRG